MNNPITGAATAQDSAVSRERTREQRRYEIARDVMAGFAFNRWQTESNKYLARCAVECADALIAELEKSK